MTAMLPSPMASAGGISACTERVMRPPSHRASASPSASAVSEAPIHQAMVVCSPALSSRNGMPR